MLTTSRPKKVFSKYKEPLIPLPNLIEAQIDSYRDFLNITLEKLCTEFFPFQDYAEKKFALEFKSLSFHEPLDTESEAREKKKTFEATVKARIKLVNKILGTEHEQEITMMNLPMMTDRGTFIINGSERVITAQLSRSYGIFFTEEDAKKGKFFGAKVIPYRGVWIDMMVERDGVIYVRIDKKRKFPITLLLKIFGWDRETFLQTIKSDSLRSFIAQSYTKENAESIDDAYVDMYAKIRDGEITTAENAKETLDIIFGEDRFDLSEVGRYQFNKRCNEPTNPEDLEFRLLSKQDLQKIVEEIARLQLTPGSKADDIDHLGMRRVRYVGELVSASVRKGLSRMKRTIQDKMSTIDSESILPTHIVNTRPLQAAVREFFMMNQLSTFMPQENVIAEIEQTRTLSALGAGGLTRERAGFEVRDIHSSHYGRICPIHTPEGPNIGLVVHLALYARINHFGIIETPYVKVNKGQLTNEIVYLNAYEEEKYNIAHFGTSIDKNGKLIDELVEVRATSQQTVVPKEEVHFMDGSPYQALSIAASLIPFIESTAANRALMASSMQKQGVPCLYPEAPLVGTGIEEKVARDTGRMIIARSSGTISYVDSTQIKIKEDNGKEHTYEVTGFSMLNGNSVAHQRPLVNKGDIVEKGAILADASTTDQGQVAVGQNVLVAYMCWRGQTFEDAIVVSQRLVKQQKFSNIRIHEYECIVRDTKLGQEMTTYDIPNVSEAKLRNLDADGVVRIGAEVRAGDILVGKITPKGETELSPEEKLLRSIFGEKARDVKDTSLRMEHGKKGRIIGIKVFSREKGNDLEAGVLKKIFIEVAEIRNVQSGDKLAGRYGNKGVISVILPEEDMPYMADGTPIDIILTPLGIPGRMNIGQTLEMHLGMAAEALGYQAIVPPFMGATEEEISGELEKAGFNKDGKMTLYDGLTGEKFDQDVAVGRHYFMKLNHMVDDKMHARSVGPYSLITQQPLGGKSRLGGQRLGEMEVWALEGYGAAYTLREMLTVKSDDIAGRSQAFESILRGQPLRDPNTPASFNVLLKYLRGLVFDVTLQGKHSEDRVYEEIVEKEKGIEYQSAPQIIKPTEEEFLGEDFDVPLDLDVLEEIDAPLEVLEKESASSDNEVEN
jgi:DNA-directed RNA polymerase subunit beta